MAEFLLEWVFTSVFLILVVLALRAALGKRMSAGLRYALWAVVLVRLLVPVQLFRSPLAGTWVAAERRTEQIGDDVWKTWPAYGQDEEKVLDALGGQDGPSVTAGAFPDVPDAPALPDPPEPPSPPDLTKAPAWLGWAWLAGTAAAALVLLVSNLRFYWRLRRERIPLDEADHPLRVYVAVGLPSPCLFGVIRPAVYVTPEAAADPDMLRHVLAHEYTHYRHGDHIWSLLRCGALAVHWWNPLVWLAVRLSRRDAELACDEGALKRLGESERAGYGNTLLALVTAKPGPGDLFRCSTAMAGDKKSLKERVSRVAQTPRRVVWAVVVAVLVTALACLCAFGQAEPEAQDPVSSSDPTVSVQPVQEPDEDLETLVATHFTADTEGVPEDVIHFVGRAVREKYDDYRAYLESNPLTEEPIEFDGWRVESLGGPWQGAAFDKSLEVWRINYEFHTTTPETAMNLVNGGAYLTEEGWLCPTYPNCTYVIFQVSKGGKLGYLTCVMINDCTPENESAPELFYEQVAAELERQGLLLDWQQLGEGSSPQTDLNRNGVPETLHLTMVDGNRGQRLEVLEDGETIFTEEGYNAHAGYNALFLYREDGEDYLLRYNPYMGQGFGSYSYTLFTLEDNRETAVREGSVEFDTNFHPLRQNGGFDPEAIAAFMDEINGLLADSVQLLNTDVDLLGTFREEGRLYDSLWWLSGWQPGFVRDERAPLVENLREFQKAMEREWYTEEPVIECVNAREEGAEIWLRYRGENTLFEADYWEWGFQPPEQVQEQARVADLNGDGRDEIVFSLVWGHGTGCLVEQLYVFDAETLEQYDTSGLNEMILNAIQSTGDKDNFYLSAPGMDRVAISKREAMEKLGYDFETNAMSMGEIIFYTIGEDGDVRCRVACDASGNTLGYIGYIEAELDFTEDGFRIARAQYKEGDAYSD